MSFMHVVVKTVFFFIDICRHLVTYQGCAAAPDTCCFMRAICKTKVLNKIYPLKGDKSQHL